MSKPATVKMARAATITRVLKAAGMTKGEAHASGMVRGWSTFSRGFTTEQDANRRHLREQVGTSRTGAPRYHYSTESTPTGWVVVAWQFSSSDRGSEEEREQIARDEMARAAAILRAAGYHVEETTRGGTVQSAVLRVARQDADGNVVTS